MANKFIIPSIFTAVDEMSPKVLAMRHNMMSFTNSAEAGLSRAERAFRKLTPGMGQAQKQLLSMVGTGAMIAGAFQLGNFSFNALKDYEESVDSFRTIVSDLNDTEFSRFQSEIDRVAKATSKSGIQVAQSFEKIAGLNASFAETSQGIGQVSEAAITLAKASKMDLGAAAENLVGIMNQFDFSAGQANRTINALAAGQAVGAANITQTAEAFTLFGSVAKGANLTLEESVGLIQTLGKFSLFGAEAGTKLRGVILRLQKFGLGYASGQFQISDALAEVNSMLAKQHSTKLKDAIVNKIFGAENVTAGRILLNNVDTFHKFTAAVSGTSEAQKAAQINTSNLSGALDELSAEWVNILTGSSSSKEATEKLTGAVQWLTRNLGDLLSMTISAVKWYAIIKTGLLAARAAMTVWNVTLGISTALAGASSIAMKGNTVALGAQTVALNLMNFSLKGATLSQLSLNAAMAANPVGVIVFAVTALVAAIGGLIYWNRQLNEEYERSINLRMQRSYDNELKAVSDLTDRLMKLGYSYAVATRKALEFERANNLQKQQQLRTEISNLDRQRKDKEVLIPGLMVKMKLPGHGALTDQIIAKNQQLTDAMAEGDAISRRALSFTRQDPRVERQVKESEKFDRAELLRFLGAPQPDQTSAAAGRDKTELTVKIQNDSSNSVSVSQGERKLGDVMPKTSSTKQVRSAYAK